MSDSNIVDVINRSISLAPAKTFELGGYTYIDKDRTVTLFQPPVPEPIEINTLTGFIGLIEAGFEGFDPNQSLAHVDAFDRVELVAKSSDGFGRRQTLIVAKALAPERTFKFNQYMVQEEFNIALRSMFVQTPELDELVALAGNIAKKTEVTQEDDGFSQNVTAKAGTHLVRAITVKPRVTLKPFRTFLEIDQPNGEYIFRIQHDENRGNLCALFEADAGQWKIFAMRSLQEWLINNLRGSSVDEVGNIPVIA